MFCSKDGAELGSTSAALSRAAGALVWDTPRPVSVQERTLGLRVPGKQEIPAAESSSSSLQFGVSTLITAWRLARINILFFFLKYKELVSKHDNTYGFLDLTFGPEKGGIFERGFSLLSSEQALKRGSGKAEIQHCQPSRARRLSRSQRFLNNVYLTREVTEV